MALHTVEHGGRALAFARARNIDFRDVLDFSANINPLGPSPRAIDALRKSLDSIQVYPDEAADQLTKRLAAELRLPQSHILAGNGATDLLYFWLRTMRPRTATLIVPTFSEYRRALQSLNVEVEPIRLSPENHFDLPMIRPATDVVIVTNPNNPTGAYAPPEVMREWLEQVPQSTHVLLDEAFVDFAAQPSLTRDINRFANLWVLRSMTKFHAIPGLRLGYLVGKGIAELARFREPWQVNNLAEIAGLASLDDREHAEATMQYMHRERIWLWKQLQALRHIRAFPTAANFFFARCDSDNALSEVIEDLASQNILIRDCRSVEGLDGPYFRFAIKSHPDNVRLLEHFRKVR
jgi:threonine-phosphate decarboxylase